MINLDQLEAFISVATEGGFTRASAVLHRTQPAVTRRIQQLEKSLDVELFERRVRDVVLTPEGETFLPFAKDAMAILREGMDAATKGASQLPLKVALVGTLADEHLAEALRVYRSTVTDADVRLRTATSREVSVLVQRGEADLGIRYFMDSHPEIENVELGADRLMLVCPGSHPLAGRVIANASALANEQWLTFPTSADNPDSFGELIQRALLDVGISKPKVTIIDSLTGQKRLVQAGYGLALLPRGSCEDEIAAGSLATITVRKLRAEQPIYAITRRKTRRQQDIDEFIQVLKDRSLKHRQ